MKSSNKFIVAIIVILIIVFSVIYFVVHKSTTNNTLLKKNTSQLNSSVTSNQNNSNNNQTTNNTSESNVNVGNTQNNQATNNSSADNVNVTNTPNDQSTNSASENNSNTNNLTNKQNLRQQNESVSNNQYKPNGNSIVSQFSGNWKLGNEIAYSVNGGNPKSKIDNKELILTKELYSYNGTVITNPNYYLVTDPSESFFGSEGISGNIGDSFSFIVAVPSNIIVNKNYFMKNIMYDYNGPFITNGMLCGFGGQNNLQIYEFEK